MDDATAKRAAQDETASATPASLAEFSRIGRLMLPGWAASMRLLVCIGLGTACAMVPPLMIRLIIDRAVKERDATLLYILVAATIAAAVLGALASVWRTYLAALLGQNVVFALRCRLYESVLAQPLDFFKS